MVIDETSTIAELMAAIPESIRVFEKYGIDFCCGGARSLGQACAAAGLDSRNILSEMQALETSGHESGDAVDWRTKSLSELATYIVNTHHAFLRAELPDLVSLIEKVGKVHGEHHPEVIRLQDLFRRLKDDLEPHMFKEEHILFPYILQMDEAARSGHAAPRPFFGTVENPIRVMMGEHETAGEILREIRIVSSEYAIPEDACASFRSLYHRLPALEKDLHRHIHLENNILFPGAIALESKD